MDITRYTRPRYVASVKSATIIAGTLITPQLSRSGNVFTISNIDEEANFWELYGSTDSGTTWTLITSGVKASPSYTINPETYPNNTYQYKVRTGAQIESQSFYSSYSNVVSFTVESLTTPVVHAVSGFSSFYFTYDADEATLEVTIAKIDGTVRETHTYTNDVPTSANPLNIDYSSDTTSGTYNVYCYSTSNGWSTNTYHKQSAVSTAVSFSINKLSTPVIDTSEFTAQNLVIKWDAIGGASGYNIYLNNTLIESNFSLTRIDLSNYLSPSIDDYSVYLKAVKTNQAQYVNPYYITSDNSVAVPFGQLPTPVISISGNVVTITNHSAMDRADHFNVYDNNVLWQTIEESSSTFELESNEPKIFSINITADSNSSFLFESERSNTVTYRVLKLDAPTISYTHATGSEYYTFNWNTVTNADYYDFYIGENKIATTTALTYSTVLPAGYNVIYVKACSNSVQYLESNKSNLININTSAVIQYYATIGGTNYEYELPSSIKLTLDESMDEASLTLVPNNRKDPFEAYTPIEIYAKQEVNQYDEDGNVIGVEYTSISDIFPLHMLISQDETEEIEIGNTSKFKHHLNLIERTKLLEAELMPDFGITQPMEYTQAEGVNPNEIAPDYDIWSVNTISSVDDGDIFSAQYYGMYNAHGYANYLLYSQSRTYSFNGLNSSGFNAAKISTHYAKNATFNLPKQLSTSFSIKCLTARSAAVVPWAETTYKDSLKDYGINLIKTYKYRSHSNIWAEDDFAPETTIKTVYGSEDPGTWDLSNLSTGRYDLIFELDISDNDWNTIKNDITSGLTGYYLNRSQGTHKINFMYDGYVKYYGTTLTGCGDKYDDWMDNHTRKLRVVWSDITIMENPVSPSTTYTPWESKSIYYAINKACELASPMEGNKAAKYTIDPNFNYLDYWNYAVNASGEYILDGRGNKIKVNQYPCPEMKFQNQKSLYEVLSELGRLFYGIPRLGCYDNDHIWRDNMITFDILDQDTIEALSTTQFVDEDNLENITSTINNHASGYISDLSNVISNESHHVFPSGNQWVSIRSQDSAEPLANKSNMAITLDQPIYKVIDVLVRNYSNSDPTAYVSIVDHLYEKSVFSALNNNAEGKGRAIYYEKGSNQILGLGTLSDTNEWYATLGLSSDEYIISRILNTKVGMTISQLNAVANQLQFKVVYVPYNNSKVYTEQSNRSTIANPTYKTLNQENIVVTDSSFGKSAQTQVERLGNNSIEKNFLSSDGSLSRLPKLGQVKEYDGFKYYADTITYQINNNSVLATATFSKNFNKINDRIGINSDYRLFRIYTDDNIDRSVNINKYCYLSKSIYSNASKSTITTSLVSNVARSFNLSGSSNPMNVPDSLYIRTFSNAAGNRLQYNDYATGNLINVPASIIPLTYNRYGNSISLSGSFVDNFSSGVKAVDNYNSQRVQKDVRYVDINGECPYMGFTIFKDTGSAVISPDYWPEANWYAYPQNLNNAIYSQKIKLSKDNRERIKFNYQLHFLTYDKNLTIHQAMTSRLYRDNSWAGNFTQMSAPVYMLFTGDISKQDQIGNSNTQTVGTPSFSAYTSAKYVRINQAIVTPNKQYDGYALVWPNGKIIYSYKQNIPANVSFTIPYMYMNFTDNQVAWRNS